MLYSLLISAILLVGAPAQGQPAQSENTHRCEAITKKGTRCKNTALKNSRYCNVHQAKTPGVPQCKAITKAGSRCSRPAKYSGYCKQHYDMKQEGRL